jgi:hypothetical protein
MLKGIFLDANLESAKKDGEDTRVYQTKNKQTW